MFQKGVIKLFQHFILGVDHYYKGRNTYRAVFRGGRGGGEKFQEQKIIFVLFYYI